MSLSDAKLRSAKGQTKDCKIYDNEGLFVIVKPSGSILWRFRYRFQGKEGNLALGTYPATGLKEARERRNEARTQLEQGIDPGAEKKRHAIAAAMRAANTFKLVAEEYIEKAKADGMAPATEVKTYWLLKQLEPKLGNRPIADIEPFEVLSVLRAVERRGNIETPHRLRSFASRVFKYAIWTTRAQSDPTALLGGALRVVKVTNHAAIVDPGRLGGLLRAIDAFEGFKPLAAALQLSPHVFVRPAELRLAEWSEFDLEEACWRIPSPKTKMRREHWVPLSRESVNLLRDLRPITGDHQYLFPNIRSWQRPMSENAVNVSLRRLGFTGDEMTGHGFRSTASTLLNESGLWQPDAIEVALAHRVDKSKTRSAYMGRQAVSSTFRIKKQG